MIFRGVYRVWDDEECCGKRAKPAKLSDEVAIVHAFEIANKAGLTDEELDEQQHREIFMQDQRGALQLAEQRGEARARLEVARSLLQAGMSREEVARIAGLVSKDLPDV